MARAAYLVLIATLVRDEAGKLAPADIEGALTMAVARYSKDRPRTVVADATVSGVTLPLPDAWLDGFSELLAVEYPIGHMPPAMHAAGELVEVYHSIQGAVLVVPAMREGETCRLSYKAPHQLDDIVDTVPAMDAEPLACWAAAILCDQLANAWSNAGDATIQADASDHRSRASEFASRARDLRKRYSNDLGVDQRRAESAGVVVNLDLSASNGRDRLTHPNRWR